MLIRVGVLIGRLLRLWVMTMNNTSVNALWYVEIDQLKLVFIRGGFVFTCIDKLIHNGALIHEYLRGYLY